MKTKQIFVTGGTGLVGSYLLRYLVQEGYTHIRALHRPGSRFDLLNDITEKIEWVEGDILDALLLEDALEDAHQVYHCAAVVSFDPRDREQMLRVNVEGTSNVVNAALYQGIDKLVHVSSIATLGRSRDGLTLDESNKWVRSRFNTRYAISKFQAEQEVWRGIAEGLRAAIVNPAIILGSGRWDEGSLKLYELAWNAYPFYTKGGTGFVDVRDVARFMIRLMQSDIHNERFILSAENRSYREVVTGIARRLGTQPPAYLLPDWLRAIAWRAEWLAARLTGRRPLITRETASNAARTFYFDNSRSRNALDFSYLPLERTLDESCLQFLESTAAKPATAVLPLTDL